MLYCDLRVASNSLAAARARHVNQIFLGAASNASLTPSFGTEAGTNQIAHNRCTEKDQCDCVFPSHVHACLQIETWTCLLALTASSCEEGSSSHQYLPRFVVVYLQCLALFTQHFVHTCTQQYGTTYMYKYACVRNTCTNMYSGFPLGIKILH